MENMHDIISRLDKTNQRTMLATIIAVDGSAYRKEGTTMLVEEDGTRTGLLSAGCLEEDISARFASVWAQGPMVERYNMRALDDSSWGLDGSGCNGVVDVLLQPVNDTLLSFLRKTGQALARGQTVALIRSEDVSQYLCQTESGEMFGVWNGENPQLAGVEKSGVIYSTSLTKNLYLQVIRPKPRLFVFGAQADAKPLVQFAAKVGFSVHVVDWRPALCTKTHFPNADKRIIGFPHEVIPTLSFKKDDAVLLMTHHFQRDQEIVSHLLDVHLAYFGILGSKARTARLLAAAHVPEGIRTPVGLPIRAEGPEEIAVSVVAELIQMVKAEQRTQALT